jgi:RHS repeat-associated protein
MSPFSFPKDNGTQTWTVYNGNSADANPYADFSSSGSLQTRYLDGLAVDQIYGQTSSSGNTEWYLTDQLGSVVAIASSSAVLDQITYDPFGNIVTQTNATDAVRFGFAGMEYDSVTGLYYDHARYYDAAIGRFTTQDPKSFSAGDTNLYRYVGNGPTETTDPNGEEWVYPWEPNANWTDWHLGEALGDTINNLQVSLVGGVTAEVYLFTAHLQVSGGGGFGVDMSTGTVTGGGLITVQGGPAFGLGVGGGVFNTLTNNGSIESQGGPGVTGGVSTPIGGIDVGVGSTQGLAGNPDYLTGTLNAGASAGGGVHVDASYTSAVFLSKFSFQD